MNLDPILAQTLDSATKGYPLSSPALPISAIGAQRWSVLAGDLPLPLAVIRDSALAHNHAWMRDFTASTGVLLAPHGKTTMAPQIFAQQLAAGAWGITVANVQQLGLCVPHRRRCRASSPRWSSWACPEAAPARERSTRRSPSRAPSRRAR
jgi:D-serine dehydratase